MPMGVVHVGHVRMPMTQALVAVRVRVRLARWIIDPMRMLMVLVVDVPVRMLHRRVLMIVRVVLGEVQPYAEAHK